MVVLPLLLVLICYMAFSIVQMATLEKQYHEELKMELKGAQYSSPASKKHKQSSDKEVEDTADEISQIIEDSEKMSASMMTRNQRGLYKAIQVHFFNNPFMLFAFLFCKMAMTLLI